MAQQDHSLWKIIFGFMLVVTLLVFGGALALSDADIFNRERARAAALQANSQTAYDAQRGQIDLSVYPQLVQERALAEIRSIRAQSDADAAAAAEAQRVIQAENDRRLAAAERFDRVKLTLATLAAGGVLVVAIYALVMVAQRSIDRVLPATAGRAAQTARAVGAAPAARPAPAAPVTAAAPAAPAPPPVADPWRNPAFRATMRRLARQQEREKIARTLAEAQATAAAPPPPRANGHGPHAIPRREKQR